jgi:type II secretory pathway pseudopilin PulG
VLVILGILAAVVVVNVVGLSGRGEAESYAVDERTIQFSVSTFYSDTHAYSATGGWNEAGNYSSVHNYPTASGTASALYLGNETGMGKYMVHEVWSAPGTPATTPEIVNAAIWMGLLTNGPGDGTADTPGDSAPLAGEPGPYLNPLPKSCSMYNSSSGTGTITWIVGAYGRIYGVFEDGGRWYAGFGGRYP